MISYEKINKLTPFEVNLSQNDLLSSHITVSSTLLCPALYCVQLITVSSTLLCPTKYCVILTQRVFCFLSHFNVLRSYQAALAKHLCLQKHFIRFMKIPPKNFPKLVKGERQFMNPT